MMICCIRDKEEKKEEKKHTKFVKCNCDINSLITPNDLFSIEILSCEEKYMALGSKGSIDLFDVSDVSEVSQSQIYFSKVKVHLISIFLPKNTKFFLQRVSSPSYDIIYNLQGTLKGSFLLQDIYLYEGDPEKNTEKVSKKKIQFQDFIKFQRSSPKNLYLLSFLDMEITFNTITFQDLHKYEKEFLS